MVFRFVHTADIHLDSPLRSLALRNPDLSELVGDASRQAFVATVDLVLPSMSTHWSSPAIFTMATKRR